MLRAPLASFLFAATSLAQAGPVNGPRRIEPRYDALLHATVIPAPGERVDDATLVLRDGLIVSLQSGAPAPAGARTHDLRGRWICAGFIDAHVPVEAPAIDPNGSGAHWNRHVTPQRSALDGKGLEPKLREELRRLGFTAAMLAPKGGVFRGQTAVVLLDDPGEAEGVDRTAVVARDVFAEVGYEPAEREYPASPMGVIALIRQTLLDAQWLDAAQRAIRAGAVPREPLLDAAALQALGPRPRLLFDCRHELDALSACRIAAEHGLAFALVGCGTELRRLPALAAHGPAVILPLAFPVEPPVRALADSEAIGLRELMTWEQAPTNPRRLANAGLTVALTSDKLESRAWFGRNLHKALQHGLTPTQALAMLTVNPAKILGLEARLGALTPGRLANLAVFDAEPFGEDSRLRALWIRGRQVEIDAAPAAALAGQWRVAMALPVPLSATATITGKNEIQFAKETKLEASDVRIDESHVQWTLRQDGVEGRLRLSGIADGGRILGRGVTAAGEPFAWSAERVGDATPAKKDAGKLQPPPPESLPTPFGPYALPAESRREDVVVTGATLWTSGAAGTIQDGVLAVLEGKVAYAGPKDRAPAFPNARVIDARGKHVTPGLIDCHSHTGVHGPVNEGTQSCTAEVRISDVIDPDDVGWYRELAGGLTVVNQLHGSANPIGGQNSVVKLRWGVADPVAMRLSGAIPGIKFALGENVKQSNREVPDRRTAARYPQTRMGVESYLRDRFVAARDHAAARARFAALGEAERAHTVPPRPDLELDALAEILAGQRLIHCHSYRQDEILMLARLGQSFGFKIGTYQHVLEGYKVADAIAQSALGASAFSDWWAYKFEVYDAIPDNGAIMHAAGVCVSFNSDSDEMARRMNVEAAKAVKYGGLAPHDALRFVTLNPARQLRVDDRIGSLEPGKDGDFVIWSGDPLSPRARCEATWIEGRELFSLATDRELRAWNARERARIVQKVLASKPEAKDEGKESKIELTPIAGKPTGEELAAEVERVHRRHLAQQLRTGRRCACAFPQEEDR